METRYFRTLLTTAECGSFSKTAEILHVTQSAVSQRIKFLEEQYGHKLLDRSGSSLALTAAGEIVVEHSRLIIDQEGQLLKRLEDLTGMKRISLCCTPTYGMGFLPGVLNEFVRRNSDLADLKFLFQQPEQAIKGLLNKEFDAAILEHCGDIDTTNFHRIDLPNDELLFICAHPLVEGKEYAGLSDILNRRLYARRDGCSSKELLKQNLEKAGMAIDDFASIIVSDDLRLTIEAVRQGSGTAFVSRSLVANQLDNVELYGHHVEGFQHTRCRTILVRKDREKDPIIQSFVDCAIEAAPLDSNALEDGCVAVA